MADQGLRLFSEARLDVSTVECVRLALEYCTGVGLDFVPGDWKIGSHAIGVSHNPLVHPDLTWREGRLPFLDGAMDFVSSLESLPRIWDVAQVLREWERVLKPGGYLVISVPDNDIVKEKGAPQLPKAHVFNADGLVARIREDAPQMEVVRTFTSADRRLFCIVAKKRTESRRTILYFGPRFSTASLLARGFEKRGHAVVFVGRGGDIDPVGPIVSLPKILDCIASLGLKPDLVVRHEEGPVLEGLDMRGDLPAVYAEVHSNTSFPGHALEAKRYDYAFISQRKFLNYFREHGNPNTYWLPFGCDPDVHRIRKAATRVRDQYDVGFVGTMNNGDYYRTRKTLVDRLSKRFRTVVKSGVDFDEMAETFASCKMIFSRSALGGLHMRVFEAMSYGRLLISDRCDGLLDLFTPGEHLVVYEDDAVEDVVQYFLDHEDEREVMAARGQEEVHGRHTYGHRVDQIMDTVFGDRRDRRQEI